MVYCQTKDSNKVVCGKQVTKKELDQDGMCGFCAGHVWSEMIAVGEHKWSHADNENI